MEGGWVAVGGIVFYRNGYFVVVEDAALSVKRAGLRLPISGGRGVVGQVKPKYLRLNLYITLDNLYKTIYNSPIDKQFCLLIFKSTSFKGYSNDNRFKKSHFQSYQIVSRRG